MLPSEQLRQLISQKHNINLDSYAWPEELKNTIFSIELDHDLELNIHNLEEVFNYGFNIGHCGLTSRYIAIKFPKADLYYGKAKLLENTKNSPNGEHAWTIIDNYLIDTSLMIIIPTAKLEELGYIPEKKLSKDGARTLSEYELYDNDLRQLNKENSSQHKNK